MGADQSENVEALMERLTQHGRYHVEVSIVNAGQEGAQFFAAEIREHPWSAAARGAPCALGTLYGYGSGDTVAAALLKSEKVASDMATPGYEVVLSGGMRP